MALFGSAQRGVLYIDEEVETNSIDFKDAFSKTIKRQCGE
jgi:hypothetical protein